MHLLENKTTARLEDLDLVPDVLADRCGGTVGQEPLRVTTTTPKGDISAELALQLRRVHAPANDLHGVDGVQPGINKVRQ